MRPNLFIHTMAQRLTRWQQFHEAIGAARTSLPIRSQEVRDRLEEYEQTYAFMSQELLPQYRRDLSAMNLLHITGRQGVSVPLGSLAQITPATGPLTVNHTGQLPSVTLSFNLQPGVSIGTAVDQVQAAARQVLPSTISTGFAGTAQAFQAAQQGLLVLLILAILVIYLVLGILYESFIHPLTILSGLPFAGFGALLALVIFRLDLSIYAFVGVIMLVGIVKKNAIMMIDFAIERERREHTTARKAILEAAGVRFRPIMMTTMAALMGTLPIALGQGAGAESRRPLGIAVGGRAALLPADHPLHHPGGLHLSRCLPAAARSRKGQGTEGAPRAGAGRRDCSRGARLMRRQLVFHSMLTRPTPTRMTSAASSVLPVTGSSRIAQPRKTATIGLT